MTPSSITVPRQLQQRLSYIFSLHTFIVLFLLNIQKQNNHVIFLLNMTQYKKTSKLITSTSKTFDTRPLWLVTVACTTSMPIVFNDSINFTNPPGLCSQNTFTKYSFPSISATSTCGCNYPNLTIISKT